MTTPRPRGLAELYPLHDLLWQLRRDPALVEEYRADPTVVADRYRLGDDLAEMLRTLDVAALYRSGANPYLLFFAALELGLPRPEYYARMTR